MSDDIRSAVAGLLSTAEVYAPDGSWSEDAERKIFDRLVADGWSRVGLSEDVGGEGGDIRDAAAAVAAAVSAGHLLPLAELVLCTPALLALAPLRVTARCLLPIAVVGRRRPGGVVNIHGSRVPWGRWASHFLTIAADGDRTIVAIVDATAATIVPGHNLAGEPRDDVTLDRVLPLCDIAVGRPAAEIGAQLREAGALARSIQLAAAVERMLHITVRYTGERHQFGRALDRFQAVQQQLAVMAGESVAATAAVDLALDLAADGDWSRGAVAVAKVRTGMAATTAARIAHQLHGAVGITQEYSLQRLTRAVWSWRDECGGEDEWATVLATDLPADMWNAVAPL